MNIESRKVHIAAYKERKVVAGVFVIRCPAAGACWVGRAPDLDTIWRRLSFELATGARRRPSLQAAWQAHGPDGLAFDVLERVEEEIDSIRERKLKARLEYWRDMLGADLA